LSRSTLQPGLGQRLREERHRRGLKLVEVAAATGISVSSLSLVETGKNEPTISRLARICSLYGLRVTDLLPGQVAPPGHVLHADEAPALPFRGEGLSLSPLGPPGDARMEPVLLEFEPQAGYAEQVAIESEAFFVVLDGTLEITLDDAATEVLAAGDSLYLRAGTLHAVRNPDADRPARAVAVASPPPSAPV
jgi:transcriptional regulator with XRE-family HTH domain